MRGIRLGFGIGTGVLTLAAGLCTLWAASFPSAAFDWTLYGFGLAACALLATIGLLTVVILERRFSPVLLVPVLACVVVVVLVRANLPLQARFGLARAEFEQAILERGEPSRATPCPTRLSSYRILTCYTLGSDTYFTVLGSGFLESSGFAYLPEGEPSQPERADRAYGKLTGPWSRYTEPWS